MQHVLPISESSYRYILMRKKNDLWLNGILTGYINILGSNLFLTEIEQFATKITRIHLLKQTFAHIEHYKVLKKTKKKTTLQCHCSII